jgi:acyl carrier protein
MEPAAMALQQDVLRVLDEVLSLGGRARKFDSSTPLLGALPELDSMAVVSLITRLEERFDIVIEDDEIDGQTFGTVGSLVQLIQEKADG